MTKGYQIKGVKAFKKTNLEDYMKYTTQNSKLKMKVNVLK